MLTKCSGGPGRGSSLQRGAFPKRDRRIKPPSVRLTELSSGSDSAGGELLVTSCGGDTDMSSGRPSLIWSKYNPFDV